MGRDARRPSRQALVALYAALGAAVAGAPFLVRSQGEPLSLLTRDVFTIGRIPVYAALLSNLGAFLWCGATAVCLFTMFIGPRGGAEGFLRSTAGLSAILMVDDFWMLHEWVAPRFLGVPEEIVFAAYAGLAGIYAIRYRHRIRDAAPGLFVAAMGLLALVVALDLIEPSPAPDWWYYLEDALKLFAIGTWLAFVVSAASTALARSPE